MKTWRELVKSDGFVPQYLDLTIECASEPDRTETLTGLFLDEPIDKTTIPEGWFAYDIRYSDDDDMIPASIENKVGVNWYGTILFDHELIMLDTAKNDAYIQIYGHDFRDWEDVAVEQLVLNGIDEVYLDLWKNLSPICENIRRCSQMAFYESLESQRSVYVVSERVPVGEYAIKAVKYELQKVLVALLKADDPNHDVSLAENVWVPFDWLYPITTKGTKFYCKRCGHEVLQELHNTAPKNYPWYCPHCDENMFGFEVTTEKH